MLPGDPYAAVAEQDGNPGTPFFCTYIIMSLPNLAQEHDAGGKLDLIQAPSPHPKRLNSHTQLVCIASHRLSSEAQESDLWQNF